MHKLGLFIKQTYQQKIKKFSLLPDTHRDYKKKLYIIPKYFG